jgi:hypothetical protein
MTIDQAYRIFQSIVNKEQRGYFGPDEFNEWAIIAQIELISDRLTNVKKINDRFVPQYGYKVNEKLKDELRRLIEGPVALSLSSGMADYPDDYFYIDSIQTSVYKPIKVVDTDEYAYVKDSVIFPPVAEYPVAIFYGDHIRIDPSNTSVLWTYLRYPVDPNWDYNLQSGLPIYNSTDVPGQTGKVSQDFETDRSTHPEIVWRICKYAGVNLDLSTVTQMAMTMEGQGV